MKKNDKIWGVGLLLLAAVFFAAKKQPGTPTSDQAAPAVEPQTPMPAETLKPADMPSSVSGRYPLRNYKTA